jgi:hypothetical protein
MPVIILPKPKKELPSVEVSVNSGKGEPSTGTVCSDTNRPVKHAETSFILETPTVKQDMAVAVCSPLVFTPNQCTSIILDAHVAGMERAKILRNGKSVKSYARTCSSTWLPRNEKNDWMYRRMIETTAEINANNYGFHIDGIQSIQILRYQPLQRFYWHYDSYLDSGRKITAVVNLSDPKDYVAGGLRVLGEIHNKKYLRDRGAGVWFPSCLRHCAKAPWWGERWVLVAWFLGGNFR